MAQRRVEGARCGRKRVKRVYVELFWVLVEPRFRRRGVGTRLFEALLAACADASTASWSHGAAEVRLHVMQDNHAARAWYATLGFACTRLKRDYPEAGFASWRMVRRL